MGASYSTPLALQPADAVRVNIYRHLLVLDTPVVYQVRGRLEGQRGCAVQVLRLCRFINAEAAPIFYQENCFRLNQESLFHQFVRTVGSVNAANIKYLDLDIGSLALLNRIDCDLDEWFAQIECVSLSFDVSKQSRTQIQTETWLGANTSALLHTAKQLTGPTKLQSLVCVSGLGCQDIGPVKRWSLRLTKKRESNRQYWSSLQTAFEYYIAYLGMLYDELDEE